MGDFGHHLEVQKVGKNQKSTRRKKNGEIQSGCFGHGRYNSEYFAGMANALSGSEGGEIDTAKLRDVERLIHLEDEVEIKQKELGDLEHIEIVDDLSKKEKVIQLQKAKKRQGRSEFPN